MASTGGLKMRSMKANDIIFKSDITPRLTSFDPQEYISKTRKGSVRKNISPIKQVVNEIKTKSEYNLLSS